MSTKIYDAYKFDKNYSLTELNAIADELRKDVTFFCNKIILNQVVNRFLYFYYFKQLHGQKAVDDMVEKTKPKDDGNGNDTHDIWKAVSANEWKELYYIINFHIIDKINDTTEKSQLSAFNYKCLLQVFPMSDKILAMYFGNIDVRNFLENCKYLSDYHYQNQCDKPDEIPDSEWEQRRKDWDKAIGKDYIPANHGLGIELFDTVNVMPISIKHLKNTTQDIVFLSEKSMLTKLRDTMTSISDVVGYPHGDIRYSTWSKFTKTDAYKKWMADSNKEIKSKCHFITNPDEFIKLISQE